MPEIAAAVPPAGEQQEPMPAMSFLDHLEELRRRLVYSIIAAAVGFFVCWGYAENIFSIMQRPIKSSLPAKRTAATCSASPRTRPRTPRRVSP